MIVAALIVAILLAGLVIGLCISMCASVLRAGHRPWVPTNGRRSVAAC